MSILLENYNCFAKSDKNAIILCNDHKLLQSFSFKEVTTISEKITKMISSHIKNEPVCMGLLMNNIIYIPSIVLSLQKLNHAFVYLTLKNIEKTVTYLKVNWILTLDNTKEINLFQEIDKLEVTTKKFLIFWKKIFYIPPHLNFSDIFCVVQTSGSTGESKIIRVSNTCIQVNTLNLRNVFQITPDDVIFWGTPMTFDPSIIELLLMLMSGACLQLVPYTIRINPNTLFKALFDINRITFLQIVPSVFSHWSEDQINNILNDSKLRILAFGGEMFPNHIMRYKRKNDLKMYNLYGITEVSCWASVHEVDEKHSGDIPVGKNLEETILEVRDDNGKAVNFGIGEVFIGSSSRICYINDEIKPVQEMVFRETGDLAEVNENGIILIGRKNKIVKRYGHRINLTKIEMKIFEATGLQNKCVWSWKNKKMLTFVLIKNLPDSIKDKTLDKLRVKLINILPEECFPDFIDVINNFPLTAHGKIDERNLENMYVVPDINLNYVDTFSLLWCKHFGTSCDNLDEIKSLSFKEMGGNSISALQMLSNFRDITKLEYPNELVTYVFEKNLEDCLKFLETFGPIRKRESETYEENSSKKLKIGKNELKTLWKYNLKACVDSSPVVFEKSDEVYICVGSFSNIFAVLNENGEEIFKLELAGSIEGTPNISPCGNYIFVGCINSTMYCIDYLKKQITWQYHTTEGIKSSVCFCKNQAAVVFGSYDKSIYCVSIMDGSDIWKTVLDGSIASTPIYDGSHNKIIIATLHGSCYCLNEQDGEITWRYTCTSPVFGTPCFLTSELIALPEVCGNIRCLQSENGEMVWKFKTNGHIFSSVVHFKDCIIFGCHDTNLYVVKVSLSGPNLQSKIPLDSEISSTPCVCSIKGRDVIVAACNSGTVYVIDFKTYTVFYSLQLPGEVFSSPFVHNYKMYVGCRDNNLYCIDLDVDFKE